MKQNIKQKLKEFTHNCIIHPLIFFLPEEMGDKLHDVSARWTWKR